jgi:hypothetical protein
MLFLANENFPLSSIVRLRDAGHDAAAIFEDSPGAKDGEVLAKASQEQRFLLTFDRDYGELIYKLESPRPSGVIYFRFSPELLLSQQKFYYAFFYLRTYLCKKNLLLSNLVEYDSAHFDLI